MNYILSIVLIVEFLFNVIPSYAQTDGWKLESDKDSMLVYTRVSESSPIKELKIELDIAASLSQLVAILNDVDFYTDWVYNCTTSNVIENVDTGEFYYYIEMELPWPLSNRDLVQHSVQKQDTATLIINMFTHTESTDKKFREKKNIVRIKEGYIKWKLIPLSRNRTHLSYHLVTDPGGNIPAWLFNMVIEVAPTKTMSKLREIVSMDKYINGADYIINYDSYLIR